MGLRVGKASQWRLLGDGLSEVVLIEVTLAESAEWLFQVEGITFRGEAQRESTEGRKPITHLEGDGARSGERLPRSLEDGSRAREGERTGMLHCVTVCMGLPSTEMESERGTSMSKDVRAQF